MEAGKKLAKKTAKETAKTAAKEASKETAKAAAKEGAKVAAKVGTTVAGTAAGAETGPYVPLIGMAVGKAVGDKIDKMDAQRNSRNRKIKFFLDKMVEHHYSHMEHQFKQGENLHNFNGKDYKVVELLSPRNLLLMDMSNGNFVVGLGTSLFMRQIKGDNEEPEIGIEWEHGVYLSSKPSRIDFQGIREDYGGTKMEKDREDIRLEQEDYFTQLHKLANNPHCSEDIRELISEIMRAEFCTDKMDKFHQNLSAGIYDEDSEMKVFPVTVSKDMESVLNVRGIDLDDAIEVATNVISMAEVHMDKQKAR